MFHSKIKPEDIPVLIQTLGLSGTVVVYDPQQTLVGYNIKKAIDIATLLKSATQHNICINLSGQALEVLAFEYILEFGKSARSYKAFYAEKFLAINNPDGTIRWFLPKKSKQPNFLALYNGSGLKAKLFNFGTRFAYRLGFKKWICKNNFVLYAREMDFFQNKFGEKSVALFTGTVGKNRKAVAALCQNGTTSHFIKIPISQQARQLIFNEYHHLQTLEQYDFKDFSIPQAKMTTAGLQLSNIRPTVTLANNKISDKHIAALKELYANTCQLKQLSDLEIYNKTCENLEEIKQSLEQNETGQIERKKVERLAYNIKVLLCSLDSTARVPIAYSHGDFTPWNMYQSENQVHIYDWELAEKEQWMLFDLFHYIFQSGVLLQQGSSKEIQAAAIALQRNHIVADLIERYKLNFKDCYHWYLVCNCSYYLNLYIKQEHLHQQAYWLIDLWIKATNNAILSETKKAVSFATV